MNSVDPKTIASLFDSADPDQQHYLLNPPLAILDAMVAASADEDLPELPPLRILARNDTLYEVRQRFPLASRLQELIDDGRVGLRKSPVDQNTTGLVSETDLTAIVVIGETVELLQMDGSGNPAELFSELDDLWTDSEQYPLLAPALTPTLDVAHEQLGESFADRFTRAVEWAEELSDTTTFHAVKTALVIGAAEERLHYDVSKWGESTGVASKASFSRKKGDLEEQGIVRTEKVQVPMGRPRQRLFLVDEYRELLDEEGFDALLAAAATTE